MPSQAQAGKAFEFALINEAESIFSQNFTIDVTKDAPYQVAQDCFDLYNPAQKSNYVRAARAAIQHIRTLEPRLSYQLSAGDALQLQLMPDSAGQQGDVRDLLFIRSTQDWEIGISAKNNHKAVKHSRLSETIDFGEKWLNAPCSQIYFENITPIFSELRELQLQEVLWRNVANKQTRFYLPILAAFRSELLRINQAHNAIPSLLASYLIGNRDFYKAIKRRNVTEILGFNINGTLNRRAPGASGQPVTRVSRLRLPSEVIQFQMKPNSSDTLLLVCNEGWTISFRIHNAESLVIPSLKFDINLVGHPGSLYSHHMPWE